MKKNTQGLIDQDILQVSTKRKEDEVDVIFPEFDIPCPLEITYQSKESVVTPLIICFPRHIPYESHKIVPWRYNATVSENGKEVMIEANRSVENITDVSGMTRSGRMFSPAPL